MLSNFQKCFKQLASYLKGLHSPGGRDQSIPLQTPVAKLAVWPWASHSLSEPPLALCFPIWGHHILLCCYLSSICFLHYPVKVWLCLSVPCSIPSTRWEHKPYEQTPTVPFPSSASAAGLGAACLGLARIPFSSKNMRTLSSAGHWSEGQCQPLTQE